MSVVINGDLIHTITAILSQQDRQCTVLYVQRNNEERCCGENAINITYSKSVFVAL